MDDLCFAWVSGDVKNIEYISSMHHHKNIDYIFNASSSQSVKTWRKEVLQHIALTLL